MFFDEELTIDLTEGYSKLDHPIKVYYQDKNINILITLMKDGKNLLNEDTEEKYAGATLIRPSGQEIFVDGMEVVDNKIVFNVNTEMLDEPHEVGKYKIQLHIYEGSRAYSMATRIRSIPKFSFFIKDRIHGVLSEEYIDDPSFLHDASGALVFDKDGYTITFLE
ncbi:hypothetical protein [Clostridium sp.]|uniref:hypothetical protein n=1 Tax=Clostridium sp. TaxID=1506 RepID=UPI0025C2CBB1|nr:hypothetical protein [Clostridium sp.]